jgi:hypothetical protein
VITAGANQLLDLLLSGRHQRRASASGRRRPREYQSIYDIESAFPAQDGQKPINFISLLTVFLPKKTVYAGSGTKTVLAFYGEEYCWPDRVSEQQRLQISVSIVTVKVVPKLTRRPLPPMTI